MTRLASFHGGHSRFGDGSDDPAAIATAARERGLVAFGFTEHFDVPPELTCGEWLSTRRPGWMDEYVPAVHAAREEHAGAMDVLLGSEVEYVRGALDWTRAATAARPFDYLVGSVHFVRLDGDDLAVDGARAKFDEALRRAGTPERMQLAYYEHVTELLGWGLVNVIGHLDVIKLHMTPEQRTPTPAVRTRVAGVLEAIRDAGCAMDVNARGLIKPCAETYPAPWILAEARKIGVPVTLGDDSHGPGDVGLNLDRAVAALREAGYERMWLVRPGGVLEPSLLEGR